MEELEERKGTGTGTGSASSDGVSDGETFRILINKKAEALLQSILTRIHEGFDGGKISRHDVVNWLIERHGETLPEEHIKEIRMANFDEVMVLERLLRQAKKQGFVPDDMRAMLVKHIGLEDSSTKRRK